MGWPTTMPIPNSTRPRKADAPTDRTASTTRTSAPWANNVEIIAYSLNDWRSLCAIHAIGLVATPYDQNNIGVIELLSARLAKKFRARTHQRVKTANGYNVLRKTKK